jgi:hypothetical protein
MGSSDDFYEPDEPLEQVLEAFEQGEKRVTAAPSQGQTVRLDLDVSAVFRAASRQGWTEQLRLPGPLRLLQPLIEQPTTTTPRVTH